MPSLPRILLAALTATVLFTGSAAASPGDTALIHSVNDARAEHGRAPLRKDARLTRAAMRHSRDMVAHRYFAHASRDGARFSRRIAATGFLPHRGRWWVGENLAWGRGPDAAPDAIVRAWLRSSTHRRVLLSRRYRRVGIGMARGTPAGAERPGVTYTADFGS
jgi:uncharacterized protein YkwD